MQHTAAGAVEEAGSEAASAGANFGADHVGATTNTHSGTNCYRYPARRLEQQNALEGDDRFSVAVHLPQYICAVN
jgi:hypothetical protein